MGTARNAHSDPLCDQKETEDYIFMNPVKWERLEKGWIRKELADRLGVKQANVETWERNGAVYRKLTRKKFAEVIGISEHSFR